MAFLTMLHLNVKFLKKCGAMFHVHQTVPMLATLPIACKPKCMNTLKHTGHAKHQVPMQSNHQVEQHLHLAGQLAIRYSRRTGYDQDDLRQVGLVGLIKASRLYEPLANVPFEVYAKPHIRGEILHYLRDGVALVRLPRGVEEEGLRLSRRRNEDLNTREQMVLDHYRCKQKWSSLDHAIHPETSDHMASLDQAERRLRVKHVCTPYPGMNDQPSKRRFWRE